MHTNSDPGSFGLLLNTGNSYVDALRKKLVAVATNALRDVDAGRFDIAESAVLAIDRDIQACVTLGAMYTWCLREAVRRRERKTRPDHVAALHERALHWRQRAYPEPHTADEADDYSAGRAADRAELAAILDSSAS